MKTFTITKEFEITPDIQYALDQAIEAGGSLRSMYLLSFEIQQAADCNEATADEVANTMYATQAMENSSQQDKESDDGEIPDDWLDSVHFLVEPFPWFETKTSTHFRM
jgi:hypothetical protein